MLKFNIGLSISLFLVTAYWMAAGLGYIQAELFSTGGCFLLAAMGGIGLAAAIRNTVVDWKVNGK